MPFAEVRDIRICYEIQGARPRLLIITGTGRDLRHTPSVFDLPAARYFETLSYDQRGLGRTSKPDYPYSMADYADDASGLLDALGWHRCLVMGISFGGMVAQELALRYPDKVARLVLACSSSGGAGGASYPLHEFESLPPEQALRRHLEVSDLRRSADWQKNNAKTFAALIAEASQKKRMGAGEPGHEMGARRQLEARIAHDTWDRLPQLRIPVYICGGRHDGIAPPSNLEALHDQIPGSRLEFFEGGHQFHAQDLHAWPRIIDFLLGHPAE